MASSGDKLIYFMVGGFVGASVALLLAPRSGEETRDFLDLSTTASRPERNVSPIRSLPSR